jgi:hypothetical protein
MTGTPESAKTIVKQEASASRQVQNDRQSGPDACSSFFLLIFFFFLPLPLLSFTPFLPEHEAGP